MQHQKFDEDVIEKENEDRLMSRFSMQDLLIEP